jgi:hypothetical protein
VRRLADQGEPTCLDRSRISSNTDSAAEDLDLPTHPEVVLSGYFLIAGF